jgi:hypothetical protein
MESLITVEWKISVRFEVVETVRLGEKVASIDVELKVKEGGV